MSMRVLLPCLVALGLLCLAADPAFAQVTQIVGGGGGGLLQAFIQWLYTNIFQALIMLGILFVGVMLMLGQHSLIGIAWMAVGAIVIANYSTIAGMFGGGG